MANIYELNLRYQEALEALEFNEETGEIENLDLLNELLESKDALETKIENTLLYIKNLEADVKAIKDEELALRERRNSKENKIEFLKDNISTALQLNGYDSFETPKVKTSFRKSTKTIIDDLAKIPSKYLQEVINYKPYKADIKKAIENGEKIEGAHLENSYNLQIK